MVHEFEQKKKKREKGGRERNKKREAINIHTDVAQHT